jgi:Protein of unknown function (DUF2721)
MNVQTVTQTIQLILAPVVMITACSLLLSGLMNRFTRLNDRMRMLSGERFAALRSARQDAGLSQDYFFDYRLKEIDTQIASSLQRQELLRNPLFLLYCSIATFIADMFVIGVTALLNHALVATLALIVFLIGTGAVFLSVVMAILEIARSHHGLREEVERVARLQLPPVDQME